MPGCLLRCRCGRRKGIRKTSSSSGCARTVFSWWKRTAHPADEEHYKANVDVLMAIDAMELSNQMQPDVVVLVTGDSDFASLALRLRRHGIRVEVASGPQTLGAG